MKILVDADACPVKDIILKIGSEFKLPVFMFVDTSHILSFSDPMVTVITVDKAMDSADFALTNRTEAGDVAVTSDYGLASMLLAKRAYVVHPNGFSYDESNIDRMLFERHLSREMRRQKKGHSHIKKRSPENDEAFASYFQNLCKKLTEQ